MTENITIQVPTVTAVVLSPTQPTINAAFTITVSITEKSVTLEPVYRYAGEIYAGEV